MPRRSSISCRDFRRQHVEYVDGFLVGEALRACEQHLDGCDRCRAHDTAVRRSLMALQVLPTIEPSPDFSRRLYARLATDAAADVPVRGRRVRWGVAAAALAASVALLIVAPSPAPRVSKAVHLPAPTILAAKAPVHAPAMVAALPDSAVRPTDATRPPKRARAATEARFEALPGQAPLRTAPSAGSTSGVRLQAVTYIGQ